MFNEYADILKKLTDARLAAEDLRCALSDMITQADKTITLIQIAEMRLQDCKCACEKEKQNEVGQSDRRRVL